MMLLKKFRHYLFPPPQSLLCTFQVLKSPSSNVEKTDVDEDIDLMILNERPMSSILYTPLPPWEPSSPLPYSPCRDQILAQSEEPPWPYTLIQRVFPNDATLSSSFHHEIFCSSFGWCIRDIVEEDLSKARQCEILEEIPEQLFL